MWVRRSPSPPALHPCFIYHRFFNQAADLPRRGDTAGGGAGVDAVGGGVMHAWLMCSLLGGHSSARWLIGWLID